MRMSEQALRVLLQDARQAFARYLRLRAALRADGVSEVSVILLEASEHATWELMESPPAVAGVPARTSDISGIWMSGP